MCGQTGCLETVASRLAIAQPGLDPGLVGVDLGIVGTDLVTADGLFDGLDDRQGGLILALLLGSFAAGGSPGVTLWRPLPLTSSPLPRTWLGCIVPILRPYF